MVTRDTRWPAGAPCWVDVSVDDMPKAIAFYQALFGWDVQAGGPEAGGYATAYLRGRIVAGIDHGSRLSRRGRYLVHCGVLEPGGHIVNRTKSSTVLQAIM